MGGFVLIPADECASRQAIEGVFMRKGYDAPQEIRLADTTLLVWQHRSNGRTEKTMAQGGRALCISVGTVAYRDLPVEETLPRILEDWQAGLLDRKQLRGAYAILIHDERGLHLISDDAGMYPLFVNKERTILTSSFLAAIAHGRARHPISRHGLLEAIVTGSIAAPDTLAEDIQCLTPGSAEQGVKGLVNGVKGPTWGQPDRPRSFESAVALLVDKCRETFRAFVNSDERAIVGLGLSGGYDSRLLLALARAESAEVRTHSFWSPAHEAEVSVARELAEIAGVGLELIPVRLWSAISDVDLSCNMEDALHYYDGRTNQTMGSFNDVHTRRIRQTAMHQATIGVNGLGGELFRNREHLRDGYFKPHAWFQYYVLTPGGTACFAKASECEDFLRVLERKYAALCGRDAWKRLSRRDVREVYARVWLPYSAGPRLAAENSVTAATMPFAEHDVAAAALECTQFIGSDGRLEAAMIRHLSPSLAACRSVYGHDFRGIPVRQRLRALALGAIPISARIWRGTRRALADKARVSDIEMNRDVFGSVREGLALMKACRLPLSWDRVLADSTIRDTAFFLAHLLGAYRDRFEGGE